jgi:hypothetical protein
MAQKQGRNPQKRPKDRQQGIAILNAVWETMPHYPLDAAFYDELPDELKPHFVQWNDQLPG